MVEDSKEWGPCPVLPIFCFAKRCPQIDAGDTEPVEPRQLAHDSGERFGTAVNVAHAMMIAVNLAQAFKIQKEQLMDSSATTNQLGASRRDHGIQQVDHARETVLSASPSSGAKKLRVCASRQATRFGRSLVGFANLPNIASIPVFLRFALEAVGSPPDKTSACGAFDASPKTHILSKAKKQ